MSEITVRPASLDDIPAITRIYADAVLQGTASFEIEPPDQPEMERRYRVLVDGGFPYISAEVNGHLVGYAYAGPYRPRPAYRWSVENSIYVDSSVHRRGIGRTLLEHLIEEAEARGFRQMIAVIGDSDQTPSIELHRAVGFHVVGTLLAVGFKHGRWLDTVVMQRQLGLGASSPP